MDDFLDTDVLIDNEQWKNFYSEMLPVQNSAVNIAPTPKMDKPIGPLHSSQRGESSAGFNQVVQNHVTLANNIVQCINLEPNFDFCMDQVELWAQRAVVVHKEKQSALDYSNMNQEFLRQEIKQRDEAILRMQNEIEKEKHRSSQKIYQLKCEVHRMKKLSKDYEKQLKDANRNFQEYRAYVQHHLNHQDSFRGV